MSRGTSEELVRNLDQDTRAIAQQRIVAGRAAMLEVHQNPQALLDNRMALDVLDVGDKTDATGVAFVNRIVQPLLVGHGHWRFL